MKNVYTAAWIAIIILITAIALPGVPALADNGPEGILLSWTGDTATTQTVTWRSDTNEDAFVEYVLEAEYRLTSFVHAAQINAKCKDISLDASGAWHFEATMTGLSPATRYIYRVGNDSGWSEAVTFVTADPAAEAFSFTYMGDIQVANNAETEYALWGELALAAYAKAPDMAFGLFGGDTVESGISLTQFDLFMKNASPVFSRVPVVPTIGNHESNFIGGKAELYLDVFALPENGPDEFIEEFYSFDYGNCHITVLNSWVFSGEQSLDADDFDRIYTWIENDLRSSNATWKIVLMHHPVYPVHSDGVANAVRENWAQLFEAYGVSLVFMGHQHVYSRTYPMYDGRIDYENGIVYIMGNAGQKFYSSGDARYSERMICNIATYQLIRIDGNTLTVQTYDIDGNELDSCMLSPRAAASQGADDPLTRLMLAEALYSLSGSPVITGTNPFADATEASVIWAYENGITCGTSEAAFSPDDPITREQLAAMLYRYVQYTGQDTSQRGDTAKFTDAGEISDWAAEALSWATGVALINGMDDGTVLPKGTATRAEAAQILLNMEGMGK